MSFENFTLFLLLLIPFIIFSLLILTNKEGLERVFSKKVIERIKVDDSALSNRARNTIFLIAIFLMIVAIGHPRILKGEKEVKLSGLSTVVALDISASMRSKDRYPNRLEFAKKKLKKLVDNLADSEIMLIAFSKDIYVVSPMTSDKEVIKELIDGIDESYIQSSTNFSKLALSLKKYLKNKEPKIAILATDGGESEELKEFQKVIESENIKLYSILVATYEGAPILDKKNKAILKDDKIIMSHLNTKLGEVSQASNGDFIIASYSDERLEELANKINSNLKSKYKNKMIKVKDKIELFYYPLILSVILLLFAFSSLPSSSNNIRRDDDK